MNKSNNDAYVVGGQTPHAKRKILCLGMSYADIDGYQTTTPVRDDLDLSVRRVIECVRRDYVTEMDGRDLARCVATEYHAGAELYTVSQEDGGRYRRARHMHGNFNRTNFVRRLQEHFLCLEFDQIILDYFWIPAGWDVQHWSRTLFGHTLVELARHDVLPYRKPLDGELLGSVILPFCYHCFKEVIGSFKQLRRYYDVSFLRKHELDKVPLWAGTRQIGAKPMQYWLGKRRDQEEVYCTFGPKDVNEAGKDRTVPKQKIVDLARRLEDFGEIRFIVLTRLPPPTDGQKQRRKGQWIGLTAKEDVQRGYDSAPGRHATPTPPHHRVETAAATALPPPPKEQQQQQQIPLQEDKKQQPKLDEASKEWKCTLEKQQQLEAAAKEEEQAKEWKRTMEQNSRLPFKKRKLFKTSTLAAATTATTTSYERRGSPKTVLEADEALLNATLDEENMENCT